MKIYCHQWPKEVPWYLKYFTKFIYKDKSIEIGFSVPFKWFGGWLWYLIPNWLLDRQISNCVNYIPDCGGAMDGTKIKSLFGYVLFFEEGGIIERKWWRHFKKYKVNP